MATSKEPSVDLAKLTEAFPREAIKQRQAGGGRSLDYVEGHTVIHRLNDATNNCWDMTVRNIESKQIGDGTLMIAHVALTLPGLGTREGLGVQMVHNRGGEDLVKGCVTDGLKKAATLFGVGLELYGPDYESGEMAPQPERQAPQRPSPQNAALRPVQGPQNGNGQQRPQAGPGPITDPQKRFLWKLTQQMGWNENNLREFVAEQFQVEHVGDLSKQQATSLIDMLKIELEGPPEQGMFQGMPPAHEPDHADGYVN